MPFSGNIVTEGNSLTDPAGIGASGPSAAWVALAQAGLALGGGVTWHNTALSGNTTQQLIARAATINGYLTGATKILTVWEMTNDVGSGGANRVHAAARLLNYCAQAKAKTGANIILLSSIPRDQTIGSPYNAADCDAELLGADAILAARYASYGIDTFVNLRLNAAFANVAAASNATYYAVDKLHLKDAGYAIINSIVSPIILSYCH